MAEQGHAGLVSWHGISGHTVTCTGAKGTPHPSPSYLGWLGGSLLHSGLEVAWLLFITALSCTEQGDVTSDSPSPAHVASFPLITTH